MKRMRGGYGPRKWSVALLQILLFLSIFLPGFSLHAEEAPYLSTLLLRANQMELWKDPYWHTLLHYKKGIFGLRSLIDDPRFFLAPSGKSDPKAELEATLRGFFSAEEDETQHPVCRFVARHHWLSEKLEIDPSKLPVPECRRFAEIMDQIKPASITLIFPAAHINSPASMFGHTMLTVDTASKSRLLAYAINYSAVTRETFGPVFAIKGLFGFYPGYFSILPYYAKLQEYSDVDHRDIWEYPLNLNTDEIKRLLMHTSEMDKIYSDYYFFDENCSYDLLFLLDAARPSTHLTDEMGSWVIPVDTIRKVKENGLVTGTIYRPSRASKIKYLASLLSGGDGKTALAVARGEKEPDSILGEDLDSRRKILISDLAGEYLQYQYSKKKIELSGFQERFWKILRVRSSLGGTGEDHQVPPPDPPDTGHLSDRFRLGVGVRDGRLFEEIAFRPAYHDLLDDDRGYVEGAQIVFADIALRYYSSDHRLLLQKLDIIDIISVSPRDAFFDPYSWKITTGLLRRTGNDDDDHLVYEVTPGGGVSYKLSGKSMVYVFGETGLLLGGGLDENYAVGIGASAGLLTSLTLDWKIHLLGRGMFYNLGDRHNAWEVGLHQNFALTTNTSLRLELGFSRTHGYERPEAGLYWNIYF